MNTVKSDTVFAGSDRTRYDMWLVGHLPLPVFIATLAASIAAQQSPPPQPLSIEGAAAHVYKTVSGNELRLHVFSPRHGTSKSMPAVIFFFGGGWHSDTLQEMDAFLTRLGYLTAGSPRATDARGYYPAHKPRWTTGQRLSPAVCD